MAKIFDHQIKLCRDVNEIIEDCYVFVNHKKQLLLAINGYDMIKLSLSNLKVIEKVKIDFQFKNSISYITQDEKTENNVFIIFDHMRLYIRRMKDFKLLF